MNQSVKKFCEICQIKVEEDGIFHLHNNYFKLNLSKLLPEVDLHLTQDSVICDQCMTQITETQEIKQLQVKAKDKGVQQDRLFDNKFKEVLGNDNTICVKEEPCVENIKEEFNVGLIKEEDCDSQIIEDDFLVDINKEKSSEMYYCHDCGFCTDATRKLIQHIYKQHRKKDLMRKPSSKKIYQCDKCDYKNGYKGHLNTHILSKHTGEKPYQCDECVYKTARKDCLKLHKLTHTREYPFQCDQCDYKSARKYSLKLHKSTHTGEYPLKCDKCDYKCAFRGSLKSHNLTHTNEKPYVCAQCKCGYSSLAALKKHRTIQHWRVSLPM